MRALGPNMGAVRVPRKQSPVARQVTWKGPRWSMKRLPTKMLPTYVLACNDSKSRSLDPGLPTDVYAQWRVTTEGSDGA